MDEPISRISIEIGASSDAAQSQIDKTVSSLKVLQRQTNQRYDNPLKHLDASNFDAAKLASKLHSVDSQISKTTKAIETLQRAMATPKEGQIGPPVMDQSIAAQIRDYQRLLGSLEDQKKALRERLYLRVDANDAEKAEKKVSKLASVWNSLKRIAFYRVIRSAIKAVTQAFQEGAENAYWYAKTMGDSTKYIADAYDNLSSGSFKMSNQLGAAWATLKATLEPVLMSIINLVTQAASAITQLFAALGGRTSYLKAIDYSKEWADTTKGGAAAAKEWKNQLLGFDEINRLEEPGKGGGGGGGAATPDYENMFDEALIDERLKRLAEKVRDFAAEMNVNFKDVFFSWDDLNPEQIAKKVIVGLGMLLGGVAGFALGGWAGGIIGITVGASIGLIIDMLVFNNNGKIDESEFLSMLVMGLGGLAAAIIAISLGAGVAGAVIAFTLGASIALAIEKVSWLNPVKNQTQEVVQEYLNDLDEEFATAEPTGNYKAYLERWKRYAQREYEEIGRNSATGLNEGMEQEFTIRGWFSSLWEKIVSNVKTSFGIHSPSTVFAEIGENIVQGLWNGMENIWNDLKTWWENLSLGSFHIPVPHFDWTYSEATGLLADAMRFVGLPSTIPHLNISWYAQGGFPEDGLFMANHGELVGKFSNGRTAVANNEQITEGIAKAVYEAFVEAFTQTGGNGGNDRPVNIYLDGKQIATTTTKYQTQMARATG